jgi:hypothetical protein
MFALLLPVIFAMSGVVIGVGNWFVHGKNLQTKADAGAFAGGGSWDFPCGPQVDARIDAQARLYAGSNNPQVGRVPDANVHTVLNGTNYYDDDSNPFPQENNLFPPNTTLCASERLDVKVTEDNSFPLASLLPVFPDIKRRARVEIQEAEGLSGILPIAIRAPEPTTAAAIFYDEDSGIVKGVKYFVKSTTVSGIPAGLQGWTTINSEDNSSATSTWAQFTPGAETGVVIATSFRGACNTPAGLGFPGGNTKIVTTAAPCFEDNYVGQPVGNICNQGGATQVVNCYWTTGNWPSETVQSGLQFIQGYSTGTVTTGAPELRSVYLDSPSPATCGAYYTPLPPASCTALLHATIDVGSLVNPPPPPGGTETRVAANVEVRYRIVDDSGGTYCAFNTPTCDLNGSGGPNNTSWVTTNDLPTFDSDTQRNAIAIRVRLKNTTVGSTTCGNNFSATCEWFFTGAGRSTNVPTVAQILANPIQRSFRGSTVTAGSARWLRLTADQNCDGILDQIDGPAASQTTSTSHCFAMEMGLKGGLAVNSSDPAILLNDGVGPSQMGSVDCDPNIAQGQILTDGILTGCTPWYAKHPFDWNPLCPSANNLFSGYPSGNPGAPWDDGRWPPIRCIKTRPTGSMNQIQDGFKMRFFGNKNQNSCPTSPVDATGFVKGRNYWDIDNNSAALGGGPTGYGYKEGAHDTRFSKADPRIVTIFIAPTEAFASSGQNSYPIAGFVELYVTGFGRMRSGSNDDPCGDTPPPELDDCKGSACGYAVWGHLINYTVPSPGATPSGIICNPGSSTQPCVATLVE